MQPCVQVKRASLPSQGQYFASTQPNTVKEIESSGAFAVLQLHFFELKEPRSASDRCRPGSVMHESPWCQCIRDFSWLGSPDAKCLTLQQSVGSRPGVERANAIVKRHGRLSPVQETIRFL